MKKKTLAALLLSVSLSPALVSAEGCAQIETDTAEQETQTPIIENITPGRALTLIQNNRDNPDFIIIDVRTPEEFAQERIEGAINLDYYPEVFSDQLNELDRNKTYLVYCRTGRRSKAAADLMKELGFGQIYNISGGINDWKKEGLPTISPTQ